MRTTVQKDGVVEFPVSSPCPERVLAVKAWHLEQATTQAPVVAALTIQVTAGGQIDSACIGMEPSMAQAVLLELETIRARLEQFIASSSAPSAGAKVYPLRRCA